jgi:hypothetical protein
MWGPVIFAERQQQFVGICSPAYITVTFTYQTRRHQNKEHPRCICWLFYNNTTKMLGPAIKTVTTYFLGFFPVTASRFLSVSGVRHIKYVPNAAVSVPIRQWWKNPPKNECFWRPQTIVKGQKKKKKSNLRGHRSENILSYFIMHLKSSLVADTVLIIIHIVSATRLLIRCMVKYCKLLVQTFCRWRTLNCLTWSASGDDGRT